MNELLRVYSGGELGLDGYPRYWHDAGDGRGIKHLVRTQAGDRCVRCFHPYEPGTGLGEWSPCDDGCRHGGPVRINGAARTVGQDEDFMCYEGLRFHLERGDQAEARWRILTVHHLTGEKGDCRWWNLAALCQRCHLQIQGRVVMPQVYPFEHSPWFKPYAAGWYAWTYLGLELTREETLARLDELLALEQLSPTVAPAAGSEREVC